ncbi:hypothetical protein DES38_11916 [Streptohalobacillus salinus]|uniref:Uncharacterized protein n=1 Tax=Streptohalobacillus salinus TaxID=621096 RepID=A0A2V3VYN1_9BACI|nr:hypothetical protein [Streptohalobacillus salinus]PXW86720.1 hypothetical protein DES38_11916 [Streptohalobacillus salinus]
MVEAFLDFALGPYGRAVGRWYFENQGILNTIVVLVAMGSLFLKYKKTAHVTQE